MSISEGTTVSIAAPRILAITPADLSPLRLQDLLPALIGLVDAVQLRWPQLGAREFFERASALARISPRPWLIVNDRADVARASGVEGVHLRDDGIPPAALPEALRLELVGVSRHDEGGMRSLHGVDYALLSPVRTTESKPGATPLGEEGFRRLVVGTTRPVLALGGMRPEDLGWVLCSGGHGVAVLSGILGVEDPPARAREYRAALSAALASGDSQR